ncbi:DUF5615 family PIN-like protein [Reichenbachiella sp.]|uniref:DUF5615 family PIN-like protein n=1 Tax=Reichenbachiella sp. TaxID=2184521 RepID=UPI003B5A1CB8
MKLLVDAQLPIKLCEIFDQLHIKSFHVEDLPDGDQTSDLEIIKFADENELIVTTKDYDFYHSHMALQKPKFLFLITTGNIKNRQLFDLIRANAELIRAALETNHFVEMTNDGLIEHG